MLLVSLKAGVLNTLVAVCHADCEAFRSCCPHPCFHTVCLYSSESWIPPWSSCMPRINCLDEHKGASLSYKSICFLSCAEIIPEHHLTAPEGPSEERELETCCGNWWHWIAPKPLFKSFFCHELSLGCRLEEQQSGCGLLSWLGVPLLSLPQSHTGEMRWAQNSSQNLSQIHCPFFLHS